MNSEARHCSGYDSGRSCDAGDVSPNMFVMTIDSCDRKQVLSTVNTIVISHLDDTVATSTVHVATAGRRRRAAARAAPDAASADAQLGERCSDVAPISQGDP